MQGVLLSVLTPKPEILHEKISHCILLKATSNQNKQLRFSMKYFIKLHENIPHKSGRPQTYRLNAGLNTLRV